MRQNKRKVVAERFSILTIDDDPIMTSTLQAYFQRSGYLVDTENDPQKAIERVRDGNYDILFLDFLMTPICGDQVVEAIRQFNSNVFIILLTGHKSMVPPIKTIRELDIQGYYEKSDRFDQLELLVESCVKSIKQMNTIKNYKDGLSAIVESLPSIYHLQSMEELLANVLKAVIDLPCCCGGFLALDKDFFSKYLTIDQAYVENGNYIVYNIPGFKDYSNYEFIDQSAELLKQNGVLQKDNLNMVSIREGNDLLIGVLGIECTPQANNDFVKLLEVFARQTSSAIHNIILHLMVNDQNLELEKAYEIMKESYMETISAIRLMVDMKDIYTRGHSDRVAYYVKLIAKAMGKDDDYCERIYVAGIFHDIGKIGIADEMLLTDGKLTDDQYDKIKLHPVYGGDILNSISAFYDIAPIVRGHHERPDGLGYPDGLKAGEIMEESYIIAVADAFDAMTSGRKYRTNFSLEQAIDELKKGKGSQFSDEIVDVFLEVLIDYDNIEKALAWTYQR